MDTKKYEELKGIDFKNIENSIFDTLRGDVKEDQYLLYGTSIALLARINKKITTSEDLLVRVKEAFSEEFVVIFLRKIIKEHYSLIHKLSDSADVDTLNALILFSEPSRFTRVDEGSTPEGISSLAVKLLDIKEDDIVLDMGSGINSFLTHVSQYSSCTNLFGVEINTNNVLLASIRNFVLDTQITIIQGNAISENYATFNANKVFSNMPLGMRLPNLKNSLNSNSELKKIFKNAKRTVSGDWINSMAAYLNTRQSGRTVAVIANAGLWNEPDSELRKELIEKGVVEGIIQLPERLLSNTGISLTVLILSGNNDFIRMVDASQIVTKGRRQNTLEQKDIKDILEAYSTDTDISKKVSKEEISKQEYILTPNRYLDLENMITDGIPLGDVCLSINRGAMIKSKDLDEIASRISTPFHYLMLQNIKDGLIDSNLPNLVEIGQKLKKYCVKDKNLIISKLSPFKIATAHVEEGEELLANGNLYFLEIDEEKVNPVFVEMFLQSEAGMMQLDRYAKGAAMKSISIKDLKLIQLPNISRDEQDKIADDYNMLSEQLIIIQKQIDLVRDKKMRLMEEVL